MDHKVRFFQKPPQSFFLFGARGTGKSTWLRQQFPQALTLDLLSPEHFRQYSAYPERLRDLITAHPNQTTIIIDEIQKIPALLDVIHQLIETRPQLTFICTGSNARKLKHAGSNLLAGRMLLTTLHPFMAGELGNDFDLNTSLSIGMIPLIWGSSTPEQTLQSYVSLYLKEEIQQEGLTRNIGQFARFLETISLSHGQQLNVSQIARDCSIGRKTVEGYLEILEDMLLAFRLEIFQKHAKRHLSQHSKFYFFDTGVFQTIRPKGPLDSTEFIAGAAMEGLVAQHLRAHIAYRDHTTRLFFWRTKSGVEVDFILYGEKTFQAIEVKCSNKVHAKDVKGLLAFKDDYPDAELTLIYAGKERLKIKNVLCIPANEYLRGLSLGS